MATNGLLIEFGAKGTMSAEVRAGLLGIIAGVEGLKTEGAIEAHHFYLVVTGNRNQRIASIMLEMSHEQLEALVVNSAYIALTDSIMEIGSNVTINRAITLERMQQLTKQFE